MFQIENPILIADDILPQDVERIESSNIKGVVLTRGSFNLTLIYTTSLITNSINNIKPEI